MSETADRRKVLAQVGWAVLIAATLYVCYFNHLGALGFVGPDEPRYAWIARDMVETGDWVTPRLYGKPWFEKPVLYYWGAALCFKLFGVSETAARLPSAVSALLATLALAWLALKIYGVETACWLLLLLPTTVGMIGFSHAASPDMPFSGMLTIAMVAAAVVLGLTRYKETSSSPESPAVQETPWLALIAFGVFLGAAVLAKGPAAIVLAGGTVFFWALFTKRWRDAFRLFHPAAIVSFCVTALPWYILCARRNPDFFRVFLIEHNFQRYVTPEFGHVQPFWYFGPILLIGLLPWSVMHVITVRDIAQSWRKDAWRESRGIYTVCWALFPIVFFSLSQSKLPGYILPAIGPVVLLLARGTTRSVGVQEPLAKWLIQCVWATWWVPSIFPSFWDRILVRKLWGLDGSTDFGMGIHWSDAAFAGVLIILSVIFARSCRVALSLLLVSLTTIVMVGLFLSFASDLDPLVSPRDVAKAAIQRSGGQPIYAFRLHRGWRDGLSFYLHQEAREWDASHPGSALVITSDEGGQQIGRRGVSAGPRNSSPHAVLLRVGPPILVELLGGDKTR